MVLGGLKEGVTPLRWTYAYMTLANDGDRVSGTLAPEPGDSPVAYTEVTDQDGNTIKGGDNDSTHEPGDLRRNRRRRRRASSKRWSAAAPASTPNDRRRRAVGQDRDDREQRRRLVLRRGRRSDRLRLGRLRRLASRR